MKFFKRLKKYAAKIMRLKIEYGGSLEKDYWSEREYEQRQVLYSSLLKQTTY
ncbi:MAG: hypothetical protein HOE90_21475 [Bacteriovoracaceae bacterium]|nr:hypothetical protein [Bacteriovoracaceae bacterium]